MSNETYDTWDSARERRRARRRCHPGEPGHGGRDRLNAAVQAGDRYSPGEGFGNTEAEARRGESLDQRLAREQPEDDIDDLAFDADADRYNHPTPRPDGWSPTTREPARTAPPG